MSLLSPEDDFTLIGRRNRAPAFFMFVWAVIMGPVSIWILTNHQPGQPAWVKVLGGAFFLVSVAALYQALAAVFRRSPILRIDQKGLWLEAGGYGTIPWADITAVQVTDSTGAIIVPSEGKNGYTLLIAVRDREKYVALSHGLKKAALKILPGASRGLNQAGNFLRQGNQSRGIEVPEMNDKLFYSLDLVDLPAWRVVGAIRYWLAQGRGEIAPWPLRSLPPAKSQFHFRRKSLWLLLLVIGGAWFMAAGGKAILQAHASVQWPVAEATIQQSKVEITHHSGRHGGSTNYRPVVSYVYEVNGRSLMGNGISPGITWLKASASAEVARYSVGSRHEVHYDQNNPQTAFLEPGLSKRNFPQFVCGLIFLVAALTMFLVISFVGLPTPGQRTITFALDSLPAKIFLAGFLLIGGLFYLVYYLNH